MRVKNTFERGYFKKATEIPSYLLDTATRQFWLLIRLFSVDRHIWHCSELDQQEPFLSFDDTLYGTSNPKLIAVLFLTVTSLLFTLNDEAY